MGTQLYGAIHFNESTQELLDHMKGKTIKSITLKKNSAGDEDKKLVFSTEDGYSFSVEIYDDDEFVDSSYEFYFNLQENNPEWMQKYDR